MSPCDQSPVLSSDSTDLEGISEDTKEVALPTVRDIKFRMEEIAPMLSTIASGMGHLTSHEG